MLFKKDKASLNFWLRDLEFVFFRSDIAAFAWELHEVNMLHNYDHVIQDNV